MTVIDILIFQKWQKNQHRKYDGANVLPSSFLMTQQIIQQQEVIKIGMSIYYLTFEILHSYLFRVTVIGILIFQK